MSEVRSSREVEAEKQRIARFSTLVVMVCVLSGLWGTVVAGAWWAPLLAVAVPPACRWVFGPGLAVALLAVAVNLTTAFVLAPQTNAGLWYATAVAILTPAYSLAVWAQQRSVRARGTGAAEANSSPRILAPARDQLQPRNTDAEPWQREAEALARDNLRDVLGGSVHRGRNLSEDLRALTDEQLAEYVAWMYQARGYRVARAPLTVSGSSTLLVAHRDDGSCGVLCLPRRVPGLRVSAGVVSEAHAAMIREGATWAKVLTSTPCPDDVLRVAEYAEYAGVAVVCDQVLRSAIVDFARIYLQT